MNNGTALAQPDLQGALNEYFGFSAFKGDQEKIINTVLEGRDVFVIMPTGGGKSLCYQLPAILSEGTAIIISPLIALMKNQVDLVRNYASDDSIAHFLNSSLKKSEERQVKEDVINGKTKMLYVAPETLTKPSTIEFFRQIRVSFVSVDEAHCISEWGHDFRPEYRRIREMIEEINPSIPIIALTATATPKVQSDIVKTLKLRSPQIFISSFNRTNLHYEIRPKTNDNQAMKNIVQFVKQNGGKSGIVYVINRKTAEKVAEVLQVNGVKAAPYHAGIDHKTRSATQDGFLMEDIDVIVATIAFGMGIDKPDIRFIIHFDIPKSLENYYQETGRGGRDGMEGTCIAYFSFKDINKLEKLLRDKSVAEKERSMQLIDETVAYCETSECRRKYILHYFGEEYKEKNCGMCDNCLNPKERVDATSETQLALAAIDAVKQQHQIVYIVNFLLGKKGKEVTTFNHDALEEFGSGALEGKDETYWNSVIRHALLKGWLRKDIEQYGLLKITDTGRSFMASPTKVDLPINHNYEEQADAIITGSSKSGALDTTLLEMLKDLRRKVAKQHNLPPYVIFQDFSLEEMATQYPISSDEFARVSGVSKGKALRYGKQFSDTIKQYVSDNDIDRPDDFVVKSVVNKSGDKVKIIQSIDKKLSVEEIAQNLGKSRNEVIDELETIVNSGTKINIDYYLDEILDPYLVEDIYEYFKTSDSDSLDLAFQEFSEDDIEIENIQLVRIKFMSEMAN